SVDQASLALVLLGLFGASDVEAVHVDGLQTRHHQSVATAAGREYEAKAVRAFWTDASFMRECAPPGSSIPEPLTLWFAIEDDGTLSDLAIAPETPIAKCIRRRVADRVFPEPPAPFVARIDLSFRD
ncbi:MAG: hypothetical protein L0206_23080, partial [Actinobacteria bacterium]|nr:hypothetical protein [Actinomycetota bacterium]